MNAAKKDVEVCKATTVVKNIAFSVRKQYGVYNTLQRSPQEMQPLSDSKRIDSKKYLWCNAQKLGGREIEFETAVLSQLN